MKHQSFDFWNDEIMRINYFKKSIASASCWKLRLSFSKHFTGTRPRKEFLCSHHPIKFLILSHWPLILSIILAKRRFENPNMKESRLPDSNAQKLLAMPNRFSLVHRISIFIRIPFVCRGLDAKKYIKIYSTRFVLIFLYLLTTLPDKIFGFARRKTWNSQTMKRRFDYS